MGVRVALIADVEVILTMADRKRQEYRDFAPTFHNPAPDAAEVHRPWIQHLVADGGEKVMVLVHEGDGGKVDGFVIATLVPSPPVYDPGGLTCSIDDYAVSDADQWATVGAALLLQAQQWGKENDASQTVVVCSPKDTLKRQMLLQAGLFVASEWFTAPLRR